MKKMHLLCNAHLDPVWLWRWQEGLFEALSTFRVAADFCEQYEDFIFNHNEALLYEWVEEHDPALFERIKKLVAAGKWRIMGGWYLQPDCVMTSGESLLSQIELGRTYFEEKFGVRPTTAINFDPFGHSRGLVQILKLTGYDSYLFMRPKHFRCSFLWEGFDGSRVMARGFTSYNTAKGEAVEKVRELAENQQSPVEVCPWGIGNHGGGPSRVDLESINAYKKSADTQIVHSFAENFFADMDSANLEVKSCSLVPVMVGCYTSMVRIKQANRRLENKIAVTEKIMSLAAMNTALPYLGEELREAKKDLAFCQFHDILPGSCIKAAEEDALKMLGHGEEIADRLFVKALLKLCQGQEKAEDGTIPVLLFNPHPYDLEGEFEVAFELQDTNWGEDESTVTTIYDADGGKLPTQNEKLDYTANLDGGQKISFRAKAKAAGITRFTCRMEAAKKPVFVEFPPCGEKVRVKNDRMEAVINCKTGLIETYAVDGKLLAQNSGILEVYRDDEDPWGRRVTSFTDFETAFTLMDKKAVNEFVGYPEEAYENVRIVEDGEVRVTVQSFWEYKSTKAVVEYTVPKQGTYIDVRIRLFSNEPNKMIKYCLRSAFDAAPYGQTAFGAEQLFSDRSECVFQKWCALDGADRSLTVYNEGIYGGDFSEKSLRLSLLRTPVYAAYPIKGRQTAPHNRLLDHIDVGERTFRFRISTAEERERQAQLFNEAPYLFSFFPPGEGEKPTASVRIDDPDVILSSLRQRDGRRVMTLHNSAGEARAAKVVCGSGERVVELQPYEVKFVEF